MEVTMQSADVAAKAMRLVQEGERDAWLALFAPDALLEDPVGHAPPRRGATELAAFWDTGVAVLDNVRFDVRRLHAAPLEALALVDVAVCTPDGAAASYDAAFHYTLDEHGAIGSLRAFWDLPAVLAQLASA
jgi:steroid Delta-isomerase